MKEDLLNVVGNFIETELDYVEKSNNEIKQLQNQVEKLTQENNDLEERANVLNHENIRLKEQLHQSSLDIQELTERDIFCPTSCEKLDKYKSVIDKAIEKIQLLIDIGFDYDGYRQADSLMTLIDELVSYAKESREILRSKE